MLGNSITDVVHKESKTTDTASGSPHFSWPLRLLSPAAVIYKAAEAPADAGFLLQKA